jgi:hypothetical protein
MAQGLTTIIKKELADHFSSYRFTIIFALIAMLISVYHHICLNCHAQPDHGLYGGAEYQK